MMWVGGCVPGMFKISLFVVKEKERKVHNDLVPKKTTIEHRTMGGHRRSASVPMSYKNVRFRRCSFSIVFAVLESTGPDAVLVKYVGRLRDLTRTGRMCMRYGILLEPCGTVFFRGALR